MRVPAWKFISQVSVQSFCRSKWNENKYIANFLSKQEGDMVWHAYTKLFICKLFLFMNSLTSVRVFPRIISDNPWCSLLAIGFLRWNYNATFTHCIPNNSRPEWMTINRFFFKWLKFNKLKNNSTKCSDKPSKYVADWSVWKVLKFIKFQSH